MKGDDFCDKASHLQVQIAQCSMKLSMQLFRFTPDSLVICQKIHCCLGHPLIYISRMELTSAILQQLQSSDLVHTTENNVEYYERIKNAEGMKR